MSKIWYPYFQHKKMSDPLNVKSAKGVKIQLDNGEELIDGISSWWSVIHGYCHPRLDEAMQRQLSKMSHMMLCGLTHEPAQKLADLLIEITPPSLEHVFYSDSGSVGCEVALKTALQYWKNKKNLKKTKFLAFKKAYHGDTTGVMSVGDPDDGMHSTFKGLILDQYFLDAPPKNSSSNEDYTHYLNKMNLFFKLHHHELAAVIIEPLLQAAGGFNMYKKEFLIDLEKCCKQYDVLLIFDEVATGFGRTGSLFACNQVNVEPDLMVLGKGLTGGYIGLSATLSSEKIFNAFYTDDQEHALMHGPTFMGNPLACAVAYESIKLFLDEYYLAKISKIESTLKNQLEHFESEKVSDIRILGATAVIELHDKNDIKPIQSYAISKGVWLRPFDRYLYTMPPYVINEDELIKITSVMKESIS
tara:strand:- start:2728 stop:3975 length:1248 start_codon:yes stop_codon:yes gene_type:complete